MASPYANWSAYAYYIIGDIVQYPAGSFFKAVANNIGVTPSASSPWSTYTPPGGGGGVTSVSAGSGITVTGATATPTVSAKTANAGVGDPYGGLAVDPTYGTYIVFNSANLAIGSDNKLKWNPNASGIYVCSPTSIQTIPITGLTANGVVNVTLVCNNAGPIAFITSYVPTTDQLDLMFSNTLSSDYKIVWSVAKY
jgi:hypothetical protein